MRRVRHAAHLRHDRATDKALGHVCGQREKEAQPAARRGARRIGAGNVRHVHNRPPAMTRWLGGQRAMAVSKQVSFREQQPPEEEPELSVAPTVDYTEQPDDEETDGSDFDVPDDVGVRCQGRAAALKLTVTRRRRRCPTCRPACRSRSFPTQRSARKQRSSRWRWRGRTGGSSCTAWWKCSATP